VLSVLYLGNRKNKLRTLGADPLSAASILNLFTGAGIKKPTPIIRHQNFYWCNEYWVHENSGVLGTYAMSAGKDVGYSESKYRLRISLAHPRDCHFAHVQRLPLSTEKPQMPFREIRVMFMFAPVG